MASSTPKAAVVTRTGHAKLDFAPMQNIADKFDLVGVDVALLGSKESEKNRVSKKVLVKSARSQNAALQQLISEFEYFRSNFPFELIGELQRSLDIAQQKLAETSSTIIELNKLVESQQLEIMQLKSRQEEMALQMAVEMKAADQKFVTLDNRMEKAESRVTALETKDIVLEADHVMVNAEANLEVFLTKLVDNVKEVGDVVEVQKRTLIRHGEDLQKKAEIELVAQQGAVLANLASTVEKNHNDTHQAITDNHQRTTKRLDDISLTIAGVQDELKLKVDKTTMHELIDSKYEEIIEQLQSALESATDDDAEFNRISGQLHEVVRELCEGKADRAELQEIKEKMMFDIRIRDQLENIKQFLDMKINRDEAMTVLKADREKLSTMVSDLSKNMTVNMKKVLAEAIVTTATAATSAAASKTSRSRTKVSDGVCLSCNQKINPPATSNEKKANALQAFGQAMGGGFQVPGNAHIGKGRMPLASPQVKPVAPSELLPKIGKPTVSTPVPESSSTLVGIDGVVYQGEKSTPVSKSRKPSLSNNPANQESAR